MSYSIDDYTPSPSKKESRKKLLQHVAGDVANVWTRIARRRHGHTEVVALRLDRLEAVVDAYFGKVAQFKLRHRMDPDKDRINPPKIAALMIEAVLEGSEFERLFSVPRRLEGTDFDDAVVYDFCYAILVETLRLRVTDIDGKPKVPFVQKRDFVMCLEKFTADVEWAAWGFYNMAAAYGEILRFGD